MQIGIFPLSNQSPVRIRSRISRRDCPSRPRCHQLESRLVSHVSSPNRAYHHLRRPCGTRSWNSVLSAILHPVSNGEIQRLSRRSVLLYSTIPWCGQSNSKCLLKTYVVFIIGTLTRWHVHPEQWLHRLPDNVSFEEGALCEPLAVALAGIDRANLRLGDPLLIWYGYSCKFEGHY